LSIDLANGAKDQTTMKLSKNGANASVERVPGKKMRTLAIDIGGTGIKAIKLDENGKAISERTRIPTPKKATPKAVIGIICELAKMQDGFDRVSVGFPGVVKDCIVYTAPNLGKGWTAFELEKALQKKLGRPVRVANDADVQGLGAVSGKGLELVITLGTGFGSVIFVDGRRVHLELGHHPFHKGKTYEEELGHRAMVKKGKKKWNKLLREAIDDLKRAFNYDRLYIGGGDAKHINFKLPPEVEVVSNEDGLLGGIALWREEPTRGVTTPGTQRKDTRTVSSDGASAQGKKEPTAPEVRIAASIPPFGASERVTRAARQRSAAER
jgi:polyphosphate glucokinase